MLKSLITLAIVGTHCSSACAQSAVTPYGVIDAGVVTQRGCHGPCTTEIGSGVASESHIGLRGSEPLGNDVNAVFALDGGVLIDTGSSGDGGRLFGREAWVGLAGKYGALTLGRQSSLLYLALIEVGDPFRGGMAGSASNLIGGSRRIDNTVQYVGAFARGLSGGASYSFKEEVDTSPAGRAWGMTLGLERGPLTLRAAHQSQNAVRIQLNSKTANDTVSRNSIVAANLRLGWGTAYAAYSMSRGWAAAPLFNPDNPYSAAMAQSSSSSSRDVLVGLAVPLGARTTLLASSIRKDDRDLANQDAQQVAVGASYALSRRTDVYGAYSRIRNRNGASYTVGNASSAGKGNAALNIGLRHGF